MPGLLRHQRPAPQVRPWKKFVSCSLSFFIKNYKICDNTIAAYITTVRVGEQVRLSDRARCCAFVFVKVSLHFRCHFVWLISCAPLLGGCEMVPEGSVQVRQEDCYIFIIFLFKNKQKCKLRMRALGRWGGVKEKMVHVCTI